MADGTHIQWTDATWNIVTGCTLVDEGCRNCYAAGLAATRLKNHPSREGLARLNAAGEAKFTGEVRFNEQWLTQPLLWTRARNIFVCAHGDLFHENVPDDWLDRLFAVMALCPQHTFQVLTKRPERARAYLAHAERRFKELACDMVCDEDWPVVLSIPPKMVPPPNMVPKGYRVVDLTLWPLPNVWLGTSVSDQVSADKRIPELLACPADVRFISAEPVLGPLDLRHWVGSQPYIQGASTHHCRDGYERQDIGGGIIDGIDWVIVGGESGPGARPMHPDWARSLRDQCQAAGVPFFFKQWGEWAPRYVAGVPETDPPSGATPRAQWHDACGLIFDTLAKPDPLTFFSEGTVYRTGKVLAGRTLDGREWNEMPGVRHG